MLDSHNDPATGYKNACQDPPEMFIASSRAIPQTPLRSNGRKHRQECWGAWVVQSCEEKKWRQQTPVPWPRASQCLHGEDMGFSSWWPPDIADPPQGSHRTSQVDIRLLFRFSVLWLGSGPCRLFSPTIQVPILSFSGHRALVGRAINHTAFYQTAQAAGSVCVRQRREGNLYHHQNLLLTQPT